LRTKIPTQYQIPSSFIFATISSLKNTLDINIELAAPDNFIPTLPGWKERSLFIARYGLIDFYHYDLYSQALAKIERFHERDQIDVMEMIGRNLILKEKIRELFGYIEAELIRFPAIDPESFKQRVKDLTAPSII
jgi:hypothetical protein